MTSSSLITPRERMLKTFGFNDPDKIPVVYHPSPAGLYTHGQKLLDLFNEFPPDNPVTFDTIPQPHPSTISSDKKYHEIKKDEWGTEWEYLIFGIQGHPYTYPLKNRHSEKFVFPDIYSTFEFPKSEIPRLKQNYLVFTGWISVFEKLHALRPMDELLMDLYTKDNSLLSFIDRMTEYWTRVIDALIDAGTDVIMFGDDWGTQSSTIISPDLFREIYKPVYQKLFARVKNADRKIFFHSCGFLGEILDELFELGIDGLWPQISLYGTDDSFAQKCKEHKVTIYIHPDRQYLVPKGTPNEIKKTIEIYADRYHKLGGGGIFYVEIENDAPFENVDALVRAIHKYR